MHSSLVRSVLLATALLLVGAAGLAAQETRTDMVETCTAVALQRPLCLEAVLALEAARGAVGLAASQGSPVPGSSSTLGRRLGASPRVALSLRGSMTRAHMTDPRGGDLATAERSFTMPAVEGGIAIGVLDGISLLPTVGGLFSIDLLGGAGAARLSSESGFHESVQWFTYGARLGLLRESFTLPGVTVAAARRHLTQVHWGDRGPDVNDDAEALFDATVTSIRATAGKDFLAFGVLGGWGWERYAGRTAVAVRSPIGVDGSAESDEYSSDRSLLFGGLSYTFLVLQLAVEGGVATGWDEAAGRVAPNYDPTGGTLFGSVSGRLTF
jgi:hypothetical protein